MDYGLILRCNKGDIVLKTLPGMIRLLMCLKLDKKKEGKGDVYLGSLLCELLVQQNNVIEDLPAFDVMNNCFSLLNEEVGEMSFSVLARLVYSKSHEVNLDLVNRLFVLVHEYAALDSDILADVDNRGMRNGFTKINFGSKTATAVTAFYQTMIRQIKFNQFKIYTGEPKFGNPVFLPTRKAEIVIWKTRPVKEAAWIDDINPVLEYTFRKLKKSMSKPVNNLKTDWPEFATLNDQSPVDLYEKGHMLRMETGDSDILSATEVENEDVENEKNSTTDSDEENLLGKQLVARQSRFEEVLNSFPAPKPRKPVFTKQKLYTIDFPEYNEPANAWKISVVFRGPRAVKGNKKTAKGTPADCERVWWQTPDGSESFFDIPKRNLDVTYDSALKRLQMIVQVMGCDLPPTVQRSEEHRRILDSTDDEAILKRMLACVEKEKK